MNIKDLKFKKDPASDLTLDGEQRFIYWHGLFNCKVLKFKSSDEIFKSIENYDPSYMLSETDKMFIIQNAGKEVLCYLCHSWEYAPDVFVYGDNNIAFQIDCFE